MSRSAGDIGVLQANATVGPAVGVWRIVLITVYWPVVLYLRVLVSPRLRRSLGTGGLLSL